MVPYNIALSPENEGHSLCESQHNHGCWCQDGKRERSNLQQFLSLLFYFSLTVNHHYSCPLLSTAIPRAAKTASDRPHKPHYRSQSASYRLSPKQQISSTCSYSTEPKEIESRLSSLASSVHLVSHPSKCVCETPRQHTAADFSPPVNRNHGYQRRFLRRGVPTRIAYVEHERSGGYRGAGASRSAAGEEAQQVGPEEVRCPPA